MKGASKGNPPRARNIGDFDQHENEDHAREVQGKVKRTVKNLSGSVWCPLSHR